MKIKRVAIYLLCITSTSSTLCGFAAEAKKISQEPKNDNQICVSHRESIAKSLKQIALFTATGIDDNSAPRETNRLLQTLIETINIQTKISLMGQERCSPYEGNLSYSLYIPDAIICSIELRTLRIKGEKGNPKSCDQNNWKEITLPDIPPHNPMTPPAMFQKGPIDPKDLPPA